MSATWEYLLKDPPRKPAPPERRPRRRRWLSAGLLAVLLAGAGAYLAGRPRGDLAKVEQLRRQLDAGPAADRKAAGDRLRAEVRNLSPADRGEFFAARRREMADRMARYFTLPPAAKRKQLDEDIARMEAMRQGMGPGGPPGGGPPRSPEEAEKRRKGMLDRTTPEERAEMDKFRALADRYRQEVDRRRAQLGLPPGPGPRFGPG